MSSISRGHMSRGGLLMLNNSECHRDGYIDNVKAARKPESILQLDLNKGIRLMI